MFKVHAKRAYLLLLSAGSAAAVLGAGWLVEVVRKPAPTPQPVAASTRSWSITMADLDRRARVALAVAGLPRSDQAGKQLEAMKRRQVYVLAKLLLVGERARREGVSVSDKELQESLRAIRRARREERWRDLLATWNVHEEDVARELRRELTWRAYERRLESRVEVPEESVRRFYEANRANMRTPDLVRLRGILLKEAGQAEEVRRLAASGADFARLARRYSLDPSARSGGDLGWMALPRLHPWVRGAVAGLQPGQVSGVVRGPLGYYVVRLEGRRPGRLLSYAEARPRILADLRRSAARTEMERILYELYRDFQLRYFYPVYFDAGEHARRTLEGERSKKDS